MRAKLIGIIDDLRSLTERGRSTGHPCRKTEPKLTDHACARGERRSLRLPAGTVWIGGMAAANPSEAT